MVDETGIIDEIALIMGIKEYIIKIAQSAKNPQFSEFMDKLLNTLQVRLFQLELIHISTSAKNQVEG